MFEDRATQHAFYESFFGELEAIEKNAMLQKEALNMGSISAGANKAIDFAKTHGGKVVDTLKKGVGELKDKGLGGVRRTFTEGALEAPNKAGVGQTMLSGVGKALDTDAGKTLAMAGGAGVAAGGAGLAGAGYMAGRGRRQPPQPTR